MIWCLYSLRRIRVKWLCTIHIPTWIEDTTALPIIMQLPSQVYKSASRTTAPQAPPLHKAILTFVSRAIQIQTVRRLGRRLWFHMKFSIFGVKCDILGSGDLEIPPLASSAARAGLRCCCGAAFKRCLSFLARLRIAITTYQNDRIKTCISHDLNK